MDFLKSTLTSALSKGPPFPYTFLGRVSHHTNSSSVFTLFHATKKDDGSACSVFSFEVTDATRSQLPLAKNALRKMRTLRHPGVVKVLESVEVRACVCVCVLRECGHGGGVANPLFFLYLDRQLHIHCYGTGDAAGLAYHERRTTERDDQVGIVGSRRTFESYLYPILVNS